MYRFYFIILLLTISSANAFAQKTIDRATYERAVDYLNCELSKFYMLKEQGKYVQDEYIDYAITHPCNYENLMVFIQGKQPQLENNGFLAAYIEEFKGEYDIQASNSALYNKLVEVFEQEFFDNFEVDEDFDNLKFQIKENYLKENLRVNEILTDDGITDTEEEGNNLWTWLKELNIAALLLIGVVLFFLYKLVRWMVKYLNTGAGKITHHSNDNLPIAPKVQDTSTESALTLNEKLGQTVNASKVKTPAKTPLENEVQAVIEEHIEEEVIVARAVDNPIIEEETAAIHEDFSSTSPDEVVFYMPYPSIDGSFYDSASSEVEIPEESRFQFKLVNEKYALAIFEILSNDKIITDIFMDYEGTIKAVCDIEGGDEDLSTVLRPGIVEIITVRPGIVRKSSRHWRLKEKAVIRFEYE